MAAPRQGWTQRAMEHVGDREKALAEWLVREAAVAPAAVDALAAGAAPGELVARLARAALVPLSTLARGCEAVGLALPADDTLVDDPSAAATMADDNRPIAAAATVLDAGEVSEAGAATLAGLATLSGSHRAMSERDRRRIRRVVEGESSDLTGVNLGGHVIHGRLGSGGMGDVYRATQLSLGRTVALKVLPPRMAERPGFLERFLTEARLLARITHANIVQVYEVDTAEGIYYFTMEQVRGQSLSELIETGRELDMAVLTNMMKQCLRGLNRALREGVIHRDLKPGNILVDESGEIKIVDFGLAVPVNERGAAQSESVVGTPLYIAPEQAANAEVDFRTDIYSLGATFYHLATGQPPYEGRSVADLLRKHIELPPPDAALLRPGLPTEFCRLLQRMMAKQPADRFASYEELFRAIEQVELATGIIKSPSEFLSDSLLAIGDRGVSHLWLRAALMAVLATAALMVAVGIRELIDSAGRFELIASTGNLGTVLLGLTYASITYVALARRRLVRVIGSMRAWMQAHIVFALSSFFLVMIHSGNFLLKFTGERLVWQWGDRTRPYTIAFLPFLNSLVFLVVIISGLVGWTIWNDIVRQLNAERIRQGRAGAAEDNRLTLTVFSQTVFKYWRILHYPLAVSLFVLTVVHVVSILFWGG